MEEYVGTLIKACDSCQANEAPAGDFKIISEHRKKCPIYRAKSEFEKLPEKSLKAIVDLGSKTGLVYSYDEESRNATLTCSMPMIHENERALYIPGELLFEPDRG